MALIGVLGGMGPLAVEWSSVFAVLAAITMTAQTGGSELMRRLALDRLPRDGSGTKRNWRRQSVLPFR